jgi:Chalcone isomerase-like
MMFTNRVFRAAAALTLGAALCTGAAHAAGITQDVGGVQVENSVSLSGNTLQLNGAGVRFKAVFKVYTAALYLGKRVGTPEAVFSAPGPKRLLLTMLREMDANDLGRLFARGVESNVPSLEVNKSLMSLVRMGQIFSDARLVKAGDVIQMDWVPGTGTVISIRGVVQGEPFKEPEFYNALLRIWLGKAPADAKLKDALLGIAPATPIGNN